MVAAETLQTLHRIHIQISDLRSRLERGPRVTAIAQTTVDNTQATLETMRETMKRARMASDEKQLQLREREARVKDLGTKLNGCSSNREFQALKEQIAADEQANSVLEDEILEAMEKLDELKIAIGQQEKTLANAETELGQVQQRVSLEREGLESELGRVEAELVEVESMLPPDFCIEYKRIAKVRGEDTLAPVEGEFCGGCNTQLNPQIMNELMLSKLVFCKSCGALLYISEK